MKWFVLCQPEAGNQVPPYSKLQRAWVAHAYGDHTAGPVIAAVQTVCGPATEWPHGAAWWHAPAVHTTTPRKLDWDTCSQTASWCFDVRQSDTALNGHTSQYRCTPGRYVWRLTSSTTAFDTALQFHINSKIRLWLSHSVVVQPTSKIIPHRGRSQGSGNP